MPSEKANPSNASQSFRHGPDPDGTFKGATKLNPNDFDGGDFQTNATLEASNDVDIWRFHLKAGDTLTATTDNGQDFNPDTQLFLFDNQGNLLASDDDSGGFLQSRIDYNATQSGQYYIAVSSFNNDAAPTGGRDGPVFDGNGFSTGDYGLNLVIA